MAWDRTSRPVWLRCTAGILAAIIAAAIRLQFLEILELRVTFLTFYPAVTVSALYGGLGAGLLATVVSAALANYFWMEPIGHFAIANTADVIGLVVFLASGTLISYLAEATYRAQARAHEAEERSRLAAERERAAVDLQQSESKYRELVQNANSAIIRWKRDGTIAFFNEYAQKFFGYGAEEVMGKSVDILLPPQGSTGGDLTALVDDIVSHPERYANNVNENVLRDGRRVWMAWTNRPIFDRDGQLLEILAVGSDLTERRQAEDEVHRQREWLKVTLTSIGDAVIATDASGRITFINPVACALTGWQPEEAVGLQVQKVFRIINEKTHEPAADIAERVLREGCIVALANHTALVTRHGREIPIEDSAAPIKDETGEICGAVLVFHDVTQRRRAQASLHQSELRFRLLSKTASRLLASEDPQSLVNELCREVMEHLDCHAFFNFLADEAMGKLHLNACAGIPEEEARKIEWLDYGVAVCGCAARDDTRIVAEDIFNTPDIRTDLVKSYGIQAYACHPLRARGKVIGTLSFGTKTRTCFSPDDLSLMKTVADQVATAMEKIALVDELRRSRDELEVRVRERTAELERSNQALQDFSSIASHDLQEPLRKVSSFGSILEAKYGEALGENGREYLDRMLGATSRMQSLLRSLLEYSRVTTKAEPLREVNLGEIVRDALSDLEVRIKETGGEIQVDGLPVLEADPTQMHQLFQNLIGNALKFHRPGEKPIIKIIGRRHPGHGGLIEISVEDNGIGFDERYLDRIFQPFQRLHGRNSQFEGTGMGLAICKKIVERHGGSVAARSTPGRGSTFIIKLPVKHGMREGQSEALSPKRL